MLYTDEYCSSLRKEVGAVVFPKRKSWTLHESPEAGVVLHYLPFVFYGIWSEWGWWISRSCLQSSVKSKAVEYTSLRSHFFSVLQDPLCLHISAESNVAIGAHFAERTKSRVYGIGFHLSRRRGVLSVLQSRYEFNCGG